MSQDKPQPEQASLLEIVATLAKVLLVIGLPLYIRSQNK